MNVVADIFGSYIPLCCVGGLTFMFLVIAVVALVFFIVALRTSAQAEKDAAAQEEMPTEEKVGSKE